MLAADEVHVAAQDARLHVVGVDHVVGHQQELLAGQPVVVLLDDRGQLRDPPGRRVALQDQVQHGHEVALAAAEAAVQVGRLAGAAWTALRMNVRAASKHVASSGVTT